MTFLVNSLFGQKQEASLFEVHLGARVSQVFRHWGTVLGQGDEGAGVDPEAGEVPEGTAAPGTETVSPGEAVLAVHLVQTVEVEVRVTVETVVPVKTMEEPAVVMVLVTGQVVTVV